MLYLLPLSNKTLICLCLQNFHLRFHAADFSPHLVGHLYCLIFHTSHLTTDDLYQLSRIFLYLFHLLIHIFRGESLHLIHLLFLFSKFLCCLLVASTPSIFHLLKICTHLIILLGNLEAGIAPYLCHCLSWLLPCLIQLLLQTIHILPLVLTFSLHHLFQYVNLFLAGVNGTLLVWCFIVFLGFEVLDLVLQIYHTPLISILINEIGPFVLVIILVWNGYILASNGCILALFHPLEALLFYLYHLMSCRQGFSCGWRMKNILLLKYLIFAWAMAQSAGPSGHDSGRGEFTIRTFIK